MASTGLLSDVYANMEAINQWGASHGPVLLRSIMALVVVVLLAKVVGRLFKALLIRLGLEENRAIKVVTIMHVTLFSLLLLVTLHLLGFETMLLIRLVSILALLALMAYILFKPYLPQVPFKVGNIIQAGNQLGTVLAISFLHTKLKTLDGKIVIIPNHKVLNDLLVNYSANPFRRVDIEFFIHYGEDLDRVRALVLEAMASDERVLQKYDPRVVVRGIRPSYIEMQARFWVERRYSLVIRWAIREAIIKQLARAGVAMAAERQEYIQLPLPPGPAPGD
jgi:small conductance mechanosensitive channel